MTTPLLLDASGVAKNYGAVAALKNASLSVKPGEVHALMGANGAGKSTLVKILTGAVRPSAGTILIRGAPRRAGFRLSGTGDHSRSRCRLQSQTDGDTGRTLSAVG